MKSFFIVAVFVLAGISLCAQQQVINLYEGNAPGSENWTQTEVEYIDPTSKGQMIRNVVQPTLTVFMPENPNGSAIIICPGGGFRWLSWQHEGTEVAEWLANKGVTAFVLKYRLMNSGKTEEEFQKVTMELYGQIMAMAKDDNHKLVTSSANNAEEDVRTLAVNDGKQAIKLIRQKAAEFEIDPEKIGIMGFSAGGMLTLGVILNAGQESQPNFAASIYGGGLDGKEVPANAPPLFITVAADDFLANATVSAYHNWKEVKIPVELHVYSKGGHGFGTQKMNSPVDKWLDRFYEWLEFQVF